MASRVTRFLLWGLIAVCAAALTGCNNFFIKTTTSSGGGGSTSNLVYTVNQTTSTVSGFAVGTSTLTSVPNMPYALGFVPQAAVVTIPDTYLYVAGPGAIYAYVIGSDGSLTLPSTGAAQVVGNVLSLDVTPDGKWLIGLDGSTTQLDIYAINTSTGALVLTNTAPYTISTQGIRPKMVKVSPDGTLIFAALGSNGDAVFTFNTTAGTAVQSQSLAVSAQTSDNAVAVDPVGTHLYIARSGSGAGLASYTIGSSGALNLISGAPFAAGAQPLAVALDTTGTYAYVANGSDGTVSAFTLINGVATTIAGSPFASGTSVQSLALDKSGKYLAAAAVGGSPDLTLYSFDTTVAGKLVQAATAATGTDPAGTLLVVASH